MYFNTIPTTRTFENSQETDAVHSGAAITPRSDHLINKLIDVNIVVDILYFDFDTEAESDVLAILISLMMFLYNVQG